MELKRVYIEYECLDKPYQEGATLTRPELHEEIIKHINSIGNANPHWNKLNDMESYLRDWSW